MNRITQHKLSTHGYFTNKNILISDGTSHQNRKNWVFNRHINKQKIQILQTIVKIIILVELEISQNCT